ncbi:MAG: phytanoyl-CoA dioxygenase family protein [Gammaproteobacteria bacterium]
MSVVTSNNINEFRTIGATVLSNFWSDSEVGAIDNAIDEVALNPSPMIDIFEKDDDDNTLFFNDFNNWRRIPALKEICLNSRISDAFCLLTGSSEAYFFHDHIISKKAGTSKRTPWHIDKSYFMLDSKYTASFWMPTVKLTAEQSLSFAKGSHLERKLLMPKGFKLNNSLESQDNFLPFTESDVETNFEVISWNMNRGDVLVFDFYVIHSAPSTLLAFDRKALSLRLVGDNSTFDGRVKNPAPPFTQMGYRSDHGDPIKEAWFPKYK